LDVKPRYIVDFASHVEWSGRARLAVKRPHVVRFASHID
jgi:hypothetical protein